MSEPASQDLAYSPLDRAKYQFENAKLAFEKTIRSQETVFDEAKGIPDFLSDSFGVSRILLAFPRGATFLDELMKSNRTHVYAQLAKSEEKPEPKSLFSFNRGARKSSEQSPDAEKELEIAVRVHYYTDSNIVTIVDHVSNLVVDCGIMPSDMPADKFWPQFFSRSVGMVPKLKYTSVIIDNSTFINSISIAYAYGEPTKKRPVSDPQPVIATSDSEDDEIENKFACLTCKSVRHRTNPSYRRCVWCRFTIDTEIEGVKKVHILMDILQQLKGIPNLTDKERCVLADLVVCVVSQHKVKHFALLSLRSKPGVIYETLRNLKEEIYALLYFLVRKEVTENLHQIVPIGMDRTFHSEFETIGVPKGKIARYKLSADVFQMLHSFWEEYFTADRLEKILYYEATCEIYFYPQNVGTIPCNKKNCKNCEMMSEKKHFTSTQRRKIYEVSDSINCNARSIIYLLTCIVCRKQYVGSSSKELQARLEDHRSMARQGRGTSADVHAFYEHAKNRENVPKDKRCKVDRNRLIPLKDDPMKIYELIGIEITKPHKLAERESHWIRELESAVPHGLNEFY